MTRLSPATTHGILTCAYAVTGILIILRDREVLPVSGPWSRVLSALFILLSVWILIPPGKDKKRSRTSHAGSSVHPLCPSRSK